MTRISFALLSAFLALPGLAVQQVSVHPVAPTSVTPVVLRAPLYCPYSRHTVERTGSLIRIALFDGGLCSPPYSMTYPVSVGLLPVGEYRAEVRFEDGTEVFSEASFVVRNGGPTPYVLHPDAARAGFSSGLRLRLDPTGEGDAVCAGFGCTDVEIRIGDILVNNKVKDGRAAWFDAPALSRGFHDISVKRGDVVTIAPAVFYAFDEPDPSVFERILFPVLDDAAGAYGSRWVSEAVIANSQPWAIENWNHVQPFVCLGYPCGERIAARSRQGFAGDRYPRGIALLVPRNEARGLGFSLRVRDTSRVLEGLGTAIPVVRERDMHQNTRIVLLDVPRDPRYRVKVRGYAFDPLPFDEPTRMIVESKSGAPTTIFVHWKRECPECFPEHLSFELDLAADAENATITIEPPLESFAWAFATVTNNSTQQVTIVTPDGSRVEP